MAAVTTALRIRPGLPLLWRAVGTVQVGDDPAVAVLLERLDAADEALLDDLVAGAGRDVLRARAPGRGSTAERVDHLLGLLDGAGVLEERSAAPPPVPATAAEARAAGLVRGGDGWAALGRRAAVAVRVVGAGRTGTAVAAGLLEAGVGDVVLEDAPRRRVRRDDVAVGGHRAVDVGRGRATSAAVLPGGWAAALGRPPAQGVARPEALVVLVADGVVAPAGPAALLREDRPHLPVGLRPASAVVGPLVRPGRGPCSRCVALHRTDRDPSWPAVAAQLAHPARARDGEDAALARLVAAVTVVVVLGALDVGALDPAAPGPDGDAPAPPWSPGRDGTTPGLTWDVAVRPYPLTTARRWTPHPACGCTAVPAVRDEAPRPSGQGPDGVPGGQRP
ncbi:bacteriocin biosynthesis cyclodehydratase domain-containing protein [Pseudokineococcus lusitanus]|uniref:Bacteriocin biosynthesis cyclodehydratase domain-containing protein n=1 Tax=Pseudokineococcus lusitanus TaxID=763993 RepID=A0A3N1HUS0_9ACTN|nr:bacteriocin biosynthesis cyclodehydratase domain-containing protein [Pseudokineococcus lusitanus]